MVDLRIIFFGRLRGKRGCEALAHFRYLLGCPDRCQSNIELSPWSDRRQARGMAFVKGMKTVVLNKTKKEGAAIRSLSSETSAFLLSLRPAQ